MITLYTVDLPHPYNKIGDGPEGPEVRTVADKLRPVILGKIITKATKGERAKGDGFNNLVCPATIIMVKSYGKKLIIDCNTGISIIVSLGMTGRMQYTPGNHSHYCFTIKEVKVCKLLLLVHLCDLYFDDARYFGRIDIINTTAVPEYLSDIGPDLLAAALNESTWISLSDWIAIFTRRKWKKKVIAEILMEQDLVAGIGAYLSSEILYNAKILPNREISTLTNDEWNSLRIAAHKIILLSYSHGGFTIESFISPDGSIGKYPAAVYQRTYDPFGNSVQHGPIRETKGARTFHWVPAVQK
jgi:endonuclease-8